MYYLPGPVPGDLLNFSHHMKDLIFSSFFFSRGGNRLQNLNSLHSQNKGKGTAVCSLLTLSWVQLLKVASRPGHAMPWGALPRAPVFFQIKMVRGICALGAPPPRENPQRMLAVHHIVSLQGVLRAPGVRIHASQHYLNSLTMGISGRRP